MITKSASELPTNCAHCLDWLAHRPKAVGYYVKGKVMYGVCDNCKSNFAGVKPTTPITKVLKHYNAVNVGWDRLQFPKESGIYFVTDGKFLFYIGQTDDLRTRFHSHHKMEVFKQIENRQVFFMPVIQPVEMEKKLIKQFKPIINGMSNNYILQGV